MMRTWKALGCAIVVATLAVGAPARANTAGPLTDSQKLDEIQKQLDELKKTLATTTQTLTEMSRKVDDLTAEARVSTQSLQTNANRLKEDIDRLRTELETLRSRVPSIARGAAYPPAESVSPTGRVELVNTYGTDMAVVVNRTTYYVAPGETRLTEPIPAGQFTFEVLGVTPQQPRTLTANRIYTIHIHPQR
jgi:predicted nuclease with TOPRIM domain